MQDDHRPHAAENQAVDLSDCAFIPIPDTGIRLLTPAKELSQRLEAQFNIPTRLAFVRKLALQGIGDQEIFAQRSFAVGCTQTDLLVVVTISVLTHWTRWRGGWFAALVPIGEEKLFTEYLSQVRESVVTELRLERASGGSFS